ncbi:hypothetical protein PRSY57_1108600 [Plasmodium reichenowi]|uniref:C2 domain-containing protein n=1 Tax=Plasmodium reichenowi TaxID=5854 RepID=A0A151LBS9_PLARE|nr:hypothetical protein PRSY57_1108600 [Plasmodium reichenowi]KYN96430.1 hypothetical protein PRSY57_1108600 [Plasmodium reichenowi]
MVNNSTLNNEKFSLFSKSVILENGKHLVNVKNEKLEEYNFLNSMTNPKVTFNAKKTKGFLILQLFLYGYLNRISSFRSNKDKDLMYPYLKILLDKEEIYRSRILDNSMNIWNETIDIEIHYIKSIIEIQLYDMDETEGIVEDEYIGSAFIDLMNLKFNTKYDMILKYLDNKTAMIKDPYFHKKNKKVSEENTKKKSINVMNNLNNFNNTTNNNNNNIDNINNINNMNNIDNMNNINNMNNIDNINNIDNMNNTNNINNINNINHINNLSNPRSIIQREENINNNKSNVNKYVNDYNVRIFIKLFSKNDYSVFFLHLYKITSLNYKYICTKNEILDNELNVNLLYENINTIKLNFDMIWLPFFSIISNFSSWKKPLYSLFFVTYFFLSFFFSKYFISFLLLFLSLILFIIVSIIRECDRIQRHANANYPQPLNKNIKSPKHKNLNCFYNVDTLNNNNLNDDTNRAYNNNESFTYWRKVRRSIYQNIQYKDYLNNKKKKRTSQKDYEEINDNYCDDGDDEDDGGDGDDNDDDYNDQSDESEENYEMKDNNEKKYEENDEKKTKKQKKEVTNKHDNDIISQNDNDIISQNDNYDDIDNTSESSTFTDSSLNNVSTNEYDNFSSNSISSSEDNILNVSNKSEQKQLKDDNKNDKYEKKFSSKNIKQSNKMNKYDNIYDNKNDNNKYNYSNNSSNININNNYYTDDNIKENNLEDSNNDDSSALNYTDDENVDPENNLSVIRTFIRNIIDDNIINNIKYIHYFIYSFTKFSQIFFFILRKFGYFLVILTLLTCCLSIYFYPMIVRTLRCIIFLCGFVILTYNFKPMNIVYRFISCFHEYYYLERKRRRTSIYNYD